MLDLLADSPAALPALPSKVAVILGENEEVSFAIDGARKDLAVMQGTAERLGLAVPVTRTALASYEVAVPGGAGALDIAAKASFDLE
ncbi:NAD-binding protein [Methylobacterium nigriterrae]|uniref:NAD-binding protein n=1 Tax=Methylobacterium nigriterrae TaxID=3127512 RepID=UPI003013C913